MRIAVMAWLVCQCQLHTAPNGKRVAFGCGALGGFCCCCCSSSIWRALCLPDGNTTVYPFLTVFRFSSIWRDDEHFVVPPIGNTTIPFSLSSL
jgi:hypothetical protein